MDSSGCQHDPRKTLSGAAVPRPRTSSSTRRGRHSRPPALSPQHHPRHSCAARQPRAPRAPLHHRQTDAERDRGQELLAEVSEVFIRGRHNLGDLPIVNVYSARERAQRGDRHEAIPLMRTAVDDLFREGQLLGWGVPATGVLVETLLDRGTDNDVAEAEAAIERLAAAPTDDRLAGRDILLLRLRALLARARGDAAAYAHFRDRYRAMANRLASKDISRGLRQCHDGCRSVLLDTGVGHHGAARLELEAVARGPSYALACFAGGTPNATMRGNPAQIRASLSSENPVETYIYKPLIPSGAQAPHVAISGA